MLHIIRKNQQILMTIVVIVVIVAFVWLYNRTNLSQVGSNDVVSIYGRVVQKAEIDRQVRGYRLALALGLTDFVHDLGGMGADEEASISDFILNLLLIQHQAPELGIRPSDEAVAGVIRELPALQTDGKFDPAKYASFLQDQLAPNGFTERQMEDIVRDSLKVREIHRVVTSPVAVGEGQVREACRIYQPVDAQILRFDRDTFIKSASVTPDEVSAFYSKNREGLQSRETRSISYVVLELPVEQQKLEGHERTAALQKLADDAVAAGKSIREEVGKGIAFAKATEKMALHPKNLASVECNGSQQGKDAGIPAQVVASAFRLQKIGEVADPIQDGNSFYLVTVEGVNPARQLELAEVGEKIASLLKEKKAIQAASEAATKSLEQIRSAMASGKSFADALKAVGLKSQTLSGIIPADPKNTPEQQALAASTLALKDGELGSLQPAPWGGFAAYLVKRTPLTDAQWKEHQAILSKRLLDNEQGILFMDWLRASRAAAQIRMLGRASGRGGA